MCNKLVINTICFLKLCQTEHNLTYTEIHERKNKQLTNPTEQSPFWEANWFSASQEVPNIYGTRRFTTTFTRARHMSLFWARSIQSMPTDTTSWISSLVLSMPDSSKWSLSFTFPHKNPVCTPLVPHTCYVPCPSHSSRFCHLNDIGWGVQVIKILIMCISLPHYLVLPRPKYLPQHFILKHPQPTFLPQCQPTSFTPIQNNRQIIFPYILIFKFLDSKLEGQWFCTER